jgi:hypothetical protein
MPTVEDDELFAWVKDFAIRSVAERRFYVRTHRRILGIEREAGIFGEHNQSTPSVHLLKSIRC